MSSRAKKIPPHLQYPQLRLTILNPSASYTFPAKFKEINSDSASVSLRVLLNGLIHRGILH